MSCPTGNIPNRLCELETQVQNLVLGAGHPPMTVTFSGAADSFDEETQTLNINNDPPESSDSTKVLADQATRLSTAPDFIGQVGTQTSDPVHGNFSIWVAYGVGAGQWTLKVSSMGYQAQNNVTITGGVITGVAPIPVASGGTGGATAKEARQNLNLGSVAVLASTIDWLEAAAFTKYVTGPWSPVFDNAFDGMSIDLATIGNFTITWPAEVQWPGGTVPTPSTTNVDIYTFKFIGGAIYGSVLQNYS